MIAIPAGLPLAGM